MSATDGVYYRNGAHCVATWRSMWRSIIDLLWYRSHHLWHGANQPAWPLGHAGAAITAHTHEITSPLRVRFWEAADIKKAGYWT
jgi:hypothetical protein